MRTKLFSLSEANIVEMVTLESRVMIPLLAKSGIQVTEQEIKADIDKDQNQEVLIILRNEVPMAWIRFGIENSRLFVKSIYLDQNTNPMGSLRTLLQEATMMLATLSGMTIESVVQVANVKSLTLHKKLGFKRIKEGSKAIRYSIEADDLRTNLKRFFKIDS